MNYTLHLPENYVKPLLPGRDEWIAALRSGEYQQGEKRLSDSDGKYCCLGVLCKIQGRLGRSGLEQPRHYGLHSNNPLSGYLDREGKLPVPLNVCENERGYLSQANDDGLSFTQIADIIESVWDHAPKNW